ncbi:MAG TPA: hypothetical protein VEY67_07760 [Candidatus Dormibacteraeota bacterium]|nr:hypothetical protein [Candidatus Dormibacteraeota bacterium]
MIPKPPSEVVELAAARAAARDRRDWAEADRLRVRLEAGGWRVVDDGVGYALAPAHPADVAVAGRLYHGWSGSVPSRLEDPAVGVVTLLVVGEPDATARTIAALGADRLADAQVVLVGAGRDAEALDRQLASVPVHPEDRGDLDEVVLMAEPPSLGAALDAGIRRSASPVVIVLPDGLTPSADGLSALVRALDDPVVGVAGLHGLATSDLRHIGEVASAAIAVELAGMTFRRADYVARGPLDARLRTPMYVSLWWSLALRDEGEGIAPRRAVVVGAGADRRPDATAAVGGDDGRERDRPGRRDYYRLLDRFRDRPDLLVAEDARGSDGPRTGRPTRP